MSVEEWNRWPRFSSSSPKLDVVVDLAVEHELERAIFVRHRLMPSPRQVDDGQTAMAESDRAFHVESLVVWPAVEHGVPQPGDEVLREPVGF